MKIYHISQKQFLPVTPGEAWDFFSDPKNLSQITPGHMDFRILYTSGDRKMYPGQIIIYAITLSGLRLNWVTEITQVQHEKHFIDEQRFGPYAFWHHQHHFRPVEGGVEMTDEVNYGLPLGWLGRVVHKFFVRRVLNGIFAYRRGVLQERFGTRQPVPAT